MVQVYIVRQKGQLRQVGPVGPVGIMGVNRRVLATANKILISAFLGSLTRENVKSEKFLSLPQVKQCNRLEKDKRCIANLAHSRPLNQILNPFQQLHPLHHK